VPTIAFALPDAVGQALKVDGRGVQLDTHGAREKYEASDHLAPFRAR